MPTCHFDLLWIASNIFKRAIGRQLAATKHNECKNGASEVQLGDLRVSPHHDLMSRVVRNDFVVSLSPCGSWIISKSCQELAYTAHFSATPLLAADLFRDCPSVVLMPICHFYLSWIASKIFKRAIGRQLAAAKHNECKIGATQVHFGDLKLIRGEVKCVGS
ncbi:hypothetical protein CDAR_197841 [Caerostris darwini]|uniref:Uncharacterized protein n=1 Tax=Caerostris darwini TaxID=1538125 RepID=A0AAV4SDR7_9ARAC|nr:hypothetical protein CDAR_197841 [Caerostris darwini]